MITMTVFTQKGMNDCNTRFEKMLKEITDCQDRMARTLHDFERVSMMELYKAAQDSKKQLLYF